MARCYGILGLRPQLLFLALRVLVPALLVLAGCHARRSGETTGTFQLETTSPQVRLELLAQTPMSRARAVALLNERAYVARGLDGLTLLDVSDPARPQVITALPPEKAQPLHLAVMPGTSWLVSADRFRGVLVYETAHSEALTTVAQIAVPGIATHVNFFERAGRRYAAVACGGEGVAFLDVTDPRAPLIVSSATRGTDYVTEVLVRGGAAFVANNDDGGFELFDLTDVAQPRPLYRLYLPGYSVACDFHPPFVAVALRHRGVALLETDAHRLLGGTAPVSETTPSMRLCANWCRSPSYCQGVEFLSPSLLAVANNEMGLEIYDISQPSMPRLAAWIALAGEAVSLTRKDDLLYVSCWDGGLAIVRFTVTPSLGDEPSR